MYFANGFLLLKLRALQQTLNNVAYNGEAFRFSGFSKDCNGDYLRQPPYDDIHGRPHYICQRGDFRRHLFWAKKDNCWQVCFGILFITLIRIRSKHHHVNLHAPLRHVCLHGIVVVDLPNLH